MLLPNNGRNCFKTFGMDYERSCQSTVNRGVLNSLHISEMQGLTLCAPSHA